jgi:FlaA1/EpsC-like NDP-sugar epimerase
MIGRDAHFLKVLTIGFPIINSSIIIAFFIGFRLFVKGIHDKLGQQAKKSWKNKMFRVDELTEITIGSLLERDEISFQNEQTALCFDKSVVLVSGAAGSIGSEICRQLFGYNIRRIVLLDQSESGLSNFEFELRNRNGEVDICAEVASVRDKKRVEDIFIQYKPDYVFHAAAYKHVPIMESFPSEAILTNILGTQTLADIAVKYKVQKFIMVSTDKAVNPTNMMGATKCIAEIYIQSLSKQSGQTQFITTRFGNVLGSNGSVVPLFIKQILRGGPLTITHPDITRYFMTIPEASRLVVEACVMGGGGEIFVFNMGKPVKILEIAKKLIQLAGYTPGKEIAIEFIGLRSGEKMHEELFSESENLMPTYHPEIMMAKTRDVNSDIFKGQLENLIEYALQHQQTNVRRLIHAMLPEFKE